MIHTRGPWSFDADDMNVYSGGIPVASVYGQDDFPCLTDDDRYQCVVESNACGALIAAAPDMYEALKAMAEFWAYGLGQPDGANPTAEDQARAEQLGEQAAAALNKAEGVGQ